jgi:hypothetical protein
MSIQIAEVLKTHQDDVQNLILPLAMGNEAGFLSAMEGLLSKVAQGIPVVGSLAQDGVKLAFAGSAYRQMDAALADLKREQNEDVKWERLRAMLEVIISQALGIIIKHVRPGHEDIARKLGILDEKLSDFRSDFEARMKENDGFNIVVKNAQILDHSIGIAIKYGTSVLEYKILLENSVVKNHSILITIGDTPTKNES